MPIIENFTSLFTLIANNEGSANNMNKDTIKRLVSEYIISSMIDISESVLEFDFNVEFKYGKTTDPVGAVPTYLEM